VKLSVRLLRYADACRRFAASGEHYDGGVYSVQVDEVYRGHPGRSFEVFSENSSGRFPMQRSERYLLFISQDVDQLVVDRCGNSGLCLTKLKYSAP
jgi:hypothetical protein